jgi:uncharacterized RDD family membrane protein YckC
MEWFYASDGKKVGPVTPLAFEGLLKDNVVWADTLVWSKGQEEWRPWSQVSAETATCAASGGRYWQRDMAPYEGKFISAEHKDQYFQRLREGVSQPNQYVYGNFGRRFVAKLIDGIVNWVMSMISNVALFALFFGSSMFSAAPDPEQMGKFFAYQGVTFLVNLSLGVGYYWFFLSRYAATPGKLALGLKVIRPDGSPLTTGRIIGRYFSEMLSGMLLCIGYIMAGFDEERRALHDRICDTRVIKTR